MKVLTFDYKNSKAVVTTKKMWVTITLVMGVMFFAGYGVGTIIGKLIG